METDWRAEERIPIRRMLTPADALSLCNALLGFLAIITALSGEVRVTFTLIAFAILFDGLDGHFSRLGYGGGRLGGKLDSLADLVSFVVAPALLFWNTYADPLRSLPLGAETFTLSAIVIAVAGLFFAGGLLRLARFDYLKGGSRDYFIGVTTPGGAVVVISLCLIGWDPVPALVVVALTAVLMASRVRLPKVRGLLAPTAAVVLVTSAIVGDGFHNFGPILLLTAFLTYLVLGPGYVRRHFEPEEEPQAVF